MSYFTIRFKLCGKTACDCERFTHLYMNPILTLAVTEGHSFEDVYSFSSFSLGALIPGQCKPHAHTVFSRLGGVRGGSGCPVL